MDRVLAAMAEKQSNENIALYAAFLMPLLVLATTTFEPDTSRNKMTTRQLRMWLNVESEKLFKEAEALHKRTIKSKSNTRTRDTFRCFDAHMSAGKKELCLYIASGNRSRPLNFKAICALNQRTLLIT